MVAEAETIELDLRFHTLALDPVGESKVWYKWGFFNDEEFCVQITAGTCLSDRPPVDGNREPSSYTTFFYWIDYFYKDEIEVIMWILFVISIFGPAFFPIELALA